MADPTYLPQTAGCETLSDSDQETESRPGAAVKQQQVFIWNDHFEKWHECKLSLSPPTLRITEHEDTKVEISEKQLLHLQQRWFHGTMCRRDAKYILQDNGAGDGSFLVRTSESYEGKFAISFMYESKVKHVVIETKPDPVTGVVYHITPNGPYFDSLYSLVEEARKTKVIHNHLFDVVLTKSPPKPDQRWLHFGVKTLSQAEQLLRKEHRDGTFFVYHTSSTYAPYSLVYRSEGNFRYAPIMTSNRPSHGYSLGGVTAPALYKLIHYFMENPIHGGTVLQFPLEEEPHTHSYAIAVQGSVGDPSKNELTFSHGALITNITRKSSEWCVGNHRGDRRKFFPASAVRFLSMEEVAYITEVRGTYQEAEFDLVESQTKSTTHMLNLQKDYSIQLSSDEPTMLRIYPTNPKISNFRSFRISCPNSGDVEQWYQALQQSNCLPPICVSPTPVTARSSMRKKRRGTCVIS